MANSLVNALQSKNTTTENGMTTNSSTLNHCIDLFFTIGAMRGQDKSRLITSFSKAFNEDGLTALRILFWARDIRGGAGEREIFRDIIKYLAENHTEALAKNLLHIPEYGRWDDLLELFDTKLDTQAKSLIQDGLADPNTCGLCSKWMKRKGKHAIALERFLKLSPKAYRKTLVEKTKVVEQLMCQKKWDEVNYEHVPSLAIARYAKAFGKHDADRFTKYKTSDETKVNVGAIFPYNVVKTLRVGDEQMAEKQWYALPNYMENCNERLLPVCDVSGSMDSVVGGTTTCLDVCISLGLYISERNVGAFKDTFITFSARPVLQVLNGKLGDRFRQLERAQWDMNTNLEAVFNLILNQVVKFSVPEEEMPTAILIMSDMEFDAACNLNRTAFDMIEEKFRSAGYIMPRIIFWNIQSRNGGNFPVQGGQKNTALVSGFSPSILKSLLTGDDMSPVGIMNKTVHAERYQPIVL